MWFKGGIQKIHWNDSWNQRLTTNPQYPLNTRQACQRTFLYLLRRYWTPNVRLLVLNNAWGLDNLPTSVINHFAGNRWGCFVVVFFFFLENWWKFAGFQAWKMVCHIIFMFIGRCFVCVSFNFRNMFSIYEYTNKYSLVGE